MYGQTLSAEERVARWRERVWVVIHQARTDTMFRSATNVVDTDSTLLAQSGWRALHAGQPVIAQRYFQAAIHQDPYAISAWVGLSRTASSAEERRAYMQAALDLQFLLSNMEHTR